MSPVGSEVKPAEILESLSAEAQESAYVNERDFLDKVIDAQGMIEEGDSTTAISQRLELPIDVIEAIRSRIEESK